MNLDIANMKTIKLFILFFLLTANTICAQNNNSIINNIIDEANNNSQLERLGHELMDVIGPRLVGTPQMANAGDWAINQYKKWGSGNCTRNITTIF